MTMMVVVVVVVVVMMEVMATTGGRLLTLSRLSDRLHSPPSCGATCLVRKR